MLYLIGLGLGDQGISKQGLLTLEKCHKVYLENYTADFPYAIDDLHLGKKRIEFVDRGEVESNFLIKEAMSRKVALLVYGSPLFATTHNTLINDARHQGVRVKVIHSASVFDAIADAGLQLYKFGKITSMPTWKDNYQPDSFMDIVKENLSIKAHSLILCDIGLNFKNALEQLEKSSKNKKVKIEKIIVCSRLGNQDSKIIYNNLGGLKEEHIKPPFCIIIPAELHFLEKEMIENIPNSKEEDD